MRKRLILGLLLIAGCKEESTCSDTLSCPDAETTTGGTSGSGGTSTGGSAGTGNSASQGSGGASTTSGTGASAGGTGGNTGGTTGLGGTAGEGGSSGAPSACADACDGNTAVCDDATETCVQCVESEAHCDAPTPACDPESHECVECVVTTDCDAGVCDPETQRCVECLEDDDCDDSMLCDPEQVCVECLEHSDCTNPQEAHCDAGSCSPCASNDDCAHLAGTTVCDTGAGECVECTGTDYASCGELDGTPLVCDSLTRTCSDQKERSAVECSTCVSDAECELGQRCAREVFGGTELGYRCFWEPETEGAPAGCPVVPPYVTLKSDVTSIDGVTADLCALRSSTCKAHEDFSDSHVNCEATEDVPDASLCGEPDLNDAGCEFFGAVGDDNIYRCTVRCVSDEDCPGDNLECLTTSSGLCELNP